MSSSRGGVGVCRIIEVRLIFTPDGSSWWRRLGWSFAWRTCVGDHGGPLGGVESRVGCDKLLGPIGDVGLVFLHTLDVKCSIIGSGTDSA